MGEDTRDVYLLRHARSRANHSRRFQGEGEPLSRRGERQVATLVEYFKAHRVACVLSSDTKRAIDTARPIAEALGVPHQTSANLREVVRPTRLLGRLFYSPYSLYTMLRLLLTAGKEGYHIEDEENAFELRKRAEAALKEIEALSERRILVISHNGMVLELASLFRGEKLNPYLQRLRVITQFTKNAAGYLATKNPTTNWQIERIAPIDKNT